MPWHIARSDSCPASKPWAVIKDSDGTVEGCHSSQEAAKQQMAALYASESRAPMEQRVSDKPWSSFSASDYTSEQWRRACLIDTGIGDVDSKSRYKLPIREPGGAINRNGVHAAASVLAGGRGGVQASPDKKRAAARRLVSIYRNDLNEDPPESLLQAAGMSRGDPMADIERRYTLVPVELRARENRRSIGGYAAMFNRLSQNLGGFVEQVAPSFFNKSRGDGWPDVLARYNHDDNMLLGTTGGGTLRLEIDNTGLLYEVDPPAARADVAELVERGDVRKSSFAFRLYTDGDEWGVSDQGYPMRTLVSGQLVDVAPVNLPAYMDSSVGMRGVEVALRSLAAKVEATIEEVQALAQDNELRKLLVRTDGPAPKPKPTTFGRAAVLELQRKPDPAV